MRPRRDTETRARIGVLVASAIAVVAMMACGPEEETPDFSMSFQATPLPPVAGERVAFVLAGRGVGVVEIFQGEERVHVAVNPFDRAPAGFYSFVAKSDAIPRAIGYGQGDARIEAEATRLLGPVPEPEPPLDGGADAATDQFERDSCPGSRELALEGDGGPPVCGGAGGLLVTLRVRNLRKNPVRVERSAQPPNACAWENLGPVGVGKTASFTAFDQSALRVLDVQGGAVVRQVRLTEGGACDLVVR